MIFLRIRISRIVSADSIRIPVSVVNTARDDQQPFAGLRLIHTFQSSDHERPFNTGTLVTINDKFGLPAVDSHLASQYSGACGRFMPQDSNSGMPFRGYIVITY